MIAHAKRKCPCCWRAMRIGHRALLLNPHDDATFRLVCGRCVRRGIVVVTPPSSLESLVTKYVNRKGGRS